MNPLLKRLGRRDHGTRAEIQASKRLGGRLQHGSGNHSHSKGDILTAGFLIESKSTVAESLSVKVDWLRKIAKEAADVSKEPALILQFVDGNGKVLREGGWVMVPERVFKELLG